MSEMFQLAKLFFIATLAIGLALIVMIIFIHIISSLIVWICNKYDNWQWHKHKKLRDKYYEYPKHVDKVQEKVKSEWELTDHVHTVYCKKCRYKHNRASQYCPECGAYMTNGIKWFSADIREK